MLFVLAYERILCVPLVCCLSFGFVLHYVSYLTVYSDTVPGIAWTAAPLSTYHLTFYTLLLIQFFPYVKLTFVLSFQQMVCCIAHLNINCNRVELAYHIRVSLVPLAARLGEVHHVCIGFL